MKATLILADSAQVVAGKLYILGGGWTVTSPRVTMSAIAGKVEVPWSETSKKHRLKLELMDVEDGPVMVPTPKGNEPVIIGGEFEVGKAKDLPQGIPSDVPFAFAIPPLSLNPGKSYAWRLSIDDKTKADWQVNFVVRAK